MCAVYQERYRFHIGSYKYTWCMLLLLYIVYVIQKCYYVIIYGYIGKIYTHVSYKIIVTLITMVQDVYIIITIKGCACYFYMNYISVLYVFINFKLSYCLLCFIIYACMYYPRKGTRWQQCIHINICITFVIYPERASNTNKPFLCVSYV